MNYNDILMQGLTEIQQDANQKTGALRVFAVLKDSMQTASSLGVPWAGIAATVLNLAQAGISALEGSSTGPIDLDKLFVTSASDDLKAKGIDQSQINKAIEGQ